MTPETDLFKNDEARSKAEELATRAEELMSDVALSLSSILHGKQLIGAYPHAKEDIPVDTPIIYSAVQDEANLRINPNGSISVNFKPESYEGAQTFRKVIWWDGMEKKLLHVNDLNLSEEKKGIILANVSIQTNLDMIEELESGQVSADNLRTYIDRARESIAQTLGPFLEG